MDRTNDIDQFFKSNLDRIEVSFNESHWDKLQQSLLVAEGAITGAEVAKKQIITFKTVLIATVIALVSALIIYLLVPDTNQKQRQKQHPQHILVPSTTDSFISDATNATINRTNPANGIDTLPKRLKLNSPDSTAKTKVLKTLKDSLEEDNFIFW